MNQEPVGGSDSAPAERKIVWGGKGSEHYRAKLTESQVKEIREQYHSEYDAVHKHFYPGYRTLAKKYGVDPNTIKYVVKEGWRHV